MSGKQKGAPKLRPKLGPEVFKDQIIGKPIDSLTSSKLPTKRVILQRVRGLHTRSEIACPMTDKDIVKQLATEIQNIWERAAIPCRRIDKIQECVSKAITEVSSLMKNWSRYEEGREPFKSFVTSLDKLFDISVKDLYQKLSSSGNP